jgi:truncated hemoglobin YjbI
VHGGHTKAFDDEATLQDIFYEKVLADVRINYFFHDVDMKKQRGHQVYSVVSRGCSCFKITMP